MTTLSLDTAKIAEAAYHIWQEEGQPEGRDEAHWHAAIDRLAALEPLTQADAPAAPAKKARATKAKAAPKKAPAKPRARKAAKAE